MKEILGLIPMFIIVLLFYLFFNKYSEKSKVKDMDSKINTYSKLINAEFKFAKKVCVFLLIFILIRALYLYMNG